MVETDFGKTLLGIVIAPRVIHTEKESHEQAKSPTLGNLLPHVGDRCAIGGS
jgi:hypothetical protein